MIEIEVAEDFHVLGIKTIVTAEVRDVTIRDLDPELEELKGDLVRELSDVDLGGDPILASYRQLVRSVGRSPRKFPPAADSLIQLVGRAGRFPQINTAVDSYNVVAARSRLAFGVHDKAKISGRIRFRLSPGDEPFTAVGGGATKQTQSGDFVYADATRVLAWLDSKDSDDVKLSAATRDLIMVVQGTPETSIDYRVDAVEQACELITRFCGGSQNVQVHNCSGAGTAR